MMTHAYSESYLSDAKLRLSQFFDYLINDCHMKPDWVAALFLSSGYAEMFERGNPAILAGMSGEELAKCVVGKSYQRKTLPTHQETEDLSPEYWAGWALAEFQWHSGLRFKDIFACVKLSDIISMYPIYHEMDISQFIDTMGEKCSVAASECRLKMIREALGLSQTGLADASGVSLRSIQLYEQRVNNIDKAQAQTVYKLSRTLGCSIEDLLERPME